MTSDVSMKLRHTQLGHCELVRVEAADWIIRAESSGVLYRIPAEKRLQFQVICEPPPLPTPPLVTAPKLSPKSSVARNARRVIESLRIGLPSLDGSTHRLAVGFREAEKKMASFLHDIDSDGGGAMVLTGGYGEGKTFALTILEHIAQEKGFITARTEIDATENRLNKPHHIYRDLMRGLRIPDCEQSGVRPFAEKVQEFITRNCPGNCSQRRKWLEEQTDCYPLAWLLSDPLFTMKPSLVGLLECDPNYPVRLARQSHSYTPPTRYWPAFTAGTQGDFASFVLSGIGRLAKVMGYKGFVIIMDEMEKWHELNWAEQARAGNLLGGLLWGATAQKGRRGKSDHPRSLTHSGRGAAGGYPFTTEQPSHVGVSIAMTPRAGIEVADTWSSYGPVLVEQVPTLTDRRLKEYCRLVVPFFAEAYGMTHPTETDLQGIEDHAAHLWKHQTDSTTRSGVQSVIAAFDGWRDRH